MGSVEAKSTASSKRSNWKRSSLIWSALLQLGGCRLVPRRATQIDVAEYTFLSKLDLAVPRQLEAGGEGRGQRRATLQRRVHAVGQKIPQHRPVQRMPQHVADPLQRIVHREQVE